MLITANSHVKKCVAESQSILTGRQSSVHYGAHLHGWVTQLNRCSQQQHKVYFKEDLQV